jgi:hypothetical protein
VVAGLAVLAALVVLAACSGDPGERTDDRATPTVEPTPTGEPTPTRSPGPTTTPGQTTTPRPTKSASPRPPALGTRPPAWLGTRVLPETDTGFAAARPTPPELRNRRFTLPDTVPALPGRGFDSEIVVPVPAEVLARSTWTPDCPVGAGDLAWVRLTFHGFDGRRHTGELLVNRVAAQPLVQAFHDLYDARYPIEQMTITTLDERDAPPTGDGNDTGAFNCRPTTGGTAYSQHAYGLAIDVNPFQNPYAKGDVVLPELATSYLERGRVRAGMITADDTVVRAFARIGWEWGGAWRTLKDYQHFSANGR